MDTISERVEQIRADYETWCDALFDLRDELMNAESRPYTDYGDDGIEYMKFPSGRTAYEGGTPDEFDLSPLYSGGWPVADVDEDCFNLDGVVPGPVKLLQAMVYSAASSAYTVWDSDALSDRLYDWRHVDGDPAEHARAVADVLSDLESNLRIQQMNLTTLASVLKGDN